MTDKQLNWTLYLSLRYALMAMATPIAMYSIQSSNPSCHEDSLIAHETCCVITPEMENVSLHEDTCFLFLKRKFLLKTFYAGCCSSEATTIYCSIDKKTCKTVQMNSFASTNQVNTFPRRLQNTSWHRIPAESCLFLSKTSLVPPKVPPPRYNRYDWEDL